MRKPLTMIIPSGFQRYDCTGCGDCCRGRFAILISQEDRERIEKQEWTPEELGLKGRPLFLRRGTEFQLAHRPDGSCIFLQDDGLCKIHARHGEPEKPLACRLYPFRYVPAGSQVRVDVRFDCPATASNNGRPISDHAKFLNQLMQNGLPDDAAAIASPPFYGAMRLSWGQLCRITEAYEQVLTDVSLDITRRVTACVNLTAILTQPDIIHQDVKKLNGLLDAMVSDVQADAVGDALERVSLSNIVAPAFRQILGVYARMDRVGEKARIMKRLTDPIRMLSGKGLVPELRPDFPKIAFSQLEDYRGSLTGDAALAAERYLHTHLSGMGFFGAPFYNRSFIDGIGSLLLAYPLICWFARVYAIGAGLSEPDKGCVEKAMMIVDHQHGITPLLDMPSERYRTKLLSERGNLRSLVIWHGS